MKKFRGQIQIDFRYSEHLGPRYEGAGVSLRLITYDRYEFVNSAKWIAEDYGYAVEKGIRDGLAESDCDPDLGIRIVLESVDFDPVNSNEHSFYAAAKSVAKARDILRQYK